MMLAGRLGRGGRAEYEGRRAPPHKTWPEVSAVGNFAGGRTHPTNFGIPTIDVCVQGTRSCRDRLRLPSTESVCGPPHAVGMGTGFTTTFPQNPYKTGFGRGRPPCANPTQRGGIRRIENVSALGGKGLRRGRNGAQEAGPGRPFLGGECHIFRNFRKKSILEVEVSSG